MKTILDDCYSLSLAKAVYRNEGELRITLVELVKSETKENIEIGTGRIIKDVYAIEETQNSRTFLVEFEYAIFHQVIDESFIRIRKEEVKDTKGFIQKIENSNFEKYISENFGWYEDVIGKGIHFRICTSEEIIDVISKEEPKIKEMKKEN